MWLSELLVRAAGLRAGEKHRNYNRLMKLAIEAKSFVMGKSENGLVAIPNKIRKRFGSAPR